MQSERLNVLVVERDRWSARATRRQLEHLGCAVIVDTTVRDALLAVEREEIDVVIADYHLGDPESGADLLAELQRTRPHIGRILFADADVHCDAADVRLARPALLPDLRRALVQASFGPGKR